MVKRTLKQILIYSFQLFQLGKKKKINEWESGKGNGDIGYSEDFYELHSSSKCAATDQLMHKIKVGG